MGDDVRGRGFSETLDWPRSNRIQLVGTLTSKNVKFCSEMFVALQRQKHTVGQLLPANHFNKREIEILSLFKKKRCV